MPDWIEHLRPRLAVLRLSAGRRREIIEELSQHLDQRYDELRAAGATEAERSASPSKSYASQKRRPTDAIASSGARPPEHRTGSHDRVSGRRLFAGSAIRHAGVAEAARFRGDGRIARVRRRDVTF